MARNIFGLSPLIESKDDYYSRIQTPGIVPEVPDSPMLAGRYSSVINPEEVTKYKEAFGEEYGPLIYWGEMNKRRESDPQRLKEQLEILGPYMKDVAREKQRLGMESNVFAGLLNLPNKWQDAMSQKFAFYQPTMELLRSNATARPSFITRQYINV